MSDNERITLPEIPEDDYHEFLKECVMESMKKNEKPTVRVHFYCERCQHPWSIPSPQILNAAMEVDSSGCPRCHHTDQVKLTHHEPILAKDGEVDISEFTKIIPY